MTRTSVGARSNTNICIGFWTINFRNKGTLCSAIIAASQVILHEVATVTQIDNPIVIGLTDNQTDQLKDMSLDRHKSPCPRYGKKIVQYKNPIQMFVLLLDKVSLLNQIVHFQFH
jgi:hypothetical protein